MKDNSVIIASTSVPVEIPPIDGLWEKMMAFQPFQDYCQNLGKGPFQVERIVIQSVDLFGSKVGFIKLNARIINKSDGKPVPGIAFLRGGSVAILVILICDGKEYVAVVKQLRTPVGRLMTELPAGTLDGSGNFAGKAADELREEYELCIKEEDLIDMTTLAYGNEVPGVYASPGGTDEFFRLMLYRAAVTDIDIYQNRHTGLMSENESILTGIIPLDDLWQISDAKSLAALTLYRELQAIGKVPESAGKENDDQAS